MFVVRWLLSIIFAAVAVVFALYNRQEMSIVWDPISYNSFGVPVYLFGFACLLLGFLWGSILMWLGGWAKRREVKKQAKVITKLEKQVELSNENSSVKPSPSGFLQIK